MAERPGALARRAVAERAKFRCEYCLTPAGLTPAPFSAEHIVPRSKAGSHSQENLALSCQGCNGHKAARTEARDPATRKLVGLFNPRRQRWSVHFAWSADATMMIGKSSTGRATVIALQLNRTGLQNLRRLMVLANLHLPAVP